MSLRINQNISAVNTHRNLVQNNSRLSKSLEKLSSGLKINKASDGPASLVTSEQMRSQVSSLEQAIRNSEVSVSMVQTAEGALNEINTQLVAIRQLAVHAANEGANDDVMLRADQQEITNSLASIDRIARDTQFGTKILLDGSRGATGTTNGTDLEFVSATAASKDSTELQRVLAKKGMQEGEFKGYDVRITQEATKANITGDSNALTEDTMENGITLTISEGGKTATYESKDFESGLQTMKEFGNTIRNAGLDVEVKFDEEGMIHIEHNKYGSDYGFEVTSSVAGVFSSEQAAGDLVGANAGLDVKGTINGERAIGKGQLLTGAKGNEYTDGMVIRYTGSGKEINDREKGDLVGNVDLNQNSLTFHVGANQNQTVSIALQGMASHQLAKAVENISGFKSLSDINVETARGAQDSFVIIDNAISQVTEARANLGAFQKNTLESNLANLRVASENMRAAESSIRDADIAAEMAEFTRNQIMVQSSTAMLAQANQSPSSVLRLLN